MSIDKSVRNSVGARWGCAAAVVVGVPVIALTLLGIFIDQCGDPGYTDCTPAGWRELGYAVAITAAAGLGTGLLVTAIGAIRRAIDARRDRDA